MRTRRRGYDSASRCSATAKHASIPCTTERRMRTVLTTALYIILTFPRGHFVTLIAVGSFFAPLPRPLRTHHRGQQNAECTDTEYLRGTSARPWLCRHARRRERCESARCRRLHRCYLHRRRCLRTSASKQYSVMDNTSSAPSTAAELLTRTHRRGAALRLDAIVRRCRRWRPLPHWQQDRRACAPRRCTLSLVHDADARATHHRWPSC